jgi:predicted nucleic acid-binding protein
MVTAVAIIDTGPLVALTHERDQYHEWARQQSAQLTAPFLTCEAVLSEAWFLLRSLPKAQEKVLRLLEQGLLNVSFNSAAEINHLTELLRRYASVPMSVADACLVRMSELTSDCVIFTTDSDFNIYRRHGNQVIPVIIPPTS